MYMIENERRQQIYRDYTATMQKHLVNMLGRYLYANWQEMPSYISMVHPDQAPSPAKQETNEEAKAHVYEIFGIKPPEGGDV